MSDGDLQRRFNEKMAFEYIMPLKSEFADVVHAMRRGDLSPDQHMRLRVYLETYKRHAGLIAALVACNQADPGSPIYEWGVQTIKNRITELFTNRKLTIMPDLHATFILASLRGRGPAFDIMKYEIEVWQQVRSLLPPPGP